MSFEKTLKQEEATRVLASYKHAMCFGGAGSGKTFNILKCLVTRALKVPSRHLIIRKQLAHAKASIWYEGMPEVMEICFPDVHLKPNKAEWFWTLPNGSEIWLGGIDDKTRTEKILGRSLATIYINEASQVSNEAFLMLRTRLRQKTELNLRMWYDCNPPGKKHWTYKYFIEKTDINKNPLKNPDQYGWIQMNPADNHFLPEDYVQDLESLPTNYRKRFYEGLFTDETEGALWSQALIDRYRSKYRNYTEVLNNVKMGLTVVAVDPATSKSETSDLTGIIGLGATRTLRLGREDVYLLGDKSLRGTPSEWANAAINFFSEIDADVLVAEKNQGGDLVEANLRANGFKGKIELVHASKGKITRAEPIEAFYEQGYYHHLASDELNPLEEEMTGYVPWLLDSAESSPDRMDALVWGGTYIAQNTNHAKYMKQIDPVEIKRAARRAMGSKWQ